MRACSSRPPCNTEVPIVVVKEAGEGVLARGTPHCNSAPTAAGAGKPDHNPSANKPGSEDDEHDACTPQFWWLPWRLDFCQELEELHESPCMGAADALGLKPRRR